MIQKLDVSSNYVTLPYDITKPTRVADDVTEECVYTDQTWKDNIALNIVRATCIHGEEQDKFDSFKQWNDCLVDKTECSDMESTLQKKYLRT